VHPLDASSLLELVVVYAIEGFPLSSASLGGTLVGIVGLCVVVVFPLSISLYLHIKSFHKLVTWLVILLVQSIYHVSSLLYHLIVTLWIVSACILLYLV
jgi:Ni,Fe-hydrogenase I cytochrome b subunit